MLLGSVNPSYDGLDENDLRLSTSTSPPMSPQHSYPETMNQYLQSPTEISRSGSRNSRTTPPNATAGAARPGHYPQNSGSSHQLQPRQSYDDYMPTAVPMLNGNPMPIHYPPPHMQPISNGHHLPPSILEASPNLIEHTQVRSKSDYFNDRKK